MQSEREEIIESIRQRLRKHRECLQRKLGIEWPDDVSSEAAAESFPRLDPATVSEFHRTESALQQIREGEFGLCTRCGHEITGERLEVLPFANHCIPCQLEAVAR